MPGGDLAVQQPWRMALGHLEAAYDGGPPQGVAVAERQGRRWEQVRSVARAGVNCPVTTSAGRLFDAVSALLGVRDVAGYEGQAAIDLQHAADLAEAGGYPVPVGADGGPLVVDVAALVRALTDDLRSGTPVPLLAARSHSSLAGVVAQVCGRLRDEHGLSRVALSGGVFQNALLVQRCLER